MSDNAAFDAHRLSLVTHSYFRAARAVATGADVGDGAKFYLAQIVAFAPTERLSKAAARHLAIMSRRRRAEGDAA